MGDNAQSRGGEAAHSGTDDDSVTRPPAAAREPKRRRMTGVPLRILVVDDNVDSAQSMALLLQLEGHQVECAHDGAQALERAQASKPQVVLLDLELPQMNGYDVARTLRRSDGGDQLLLIAISGFGRDRDRAAAMEAGFDCHLTKPADPDEVIRLVTQPRPAC